MNLILVDENDIVETRGDEVHLVRIFDERRMSHLRKILKIEVGERLHVGLLNGNMGYGEVKEISAEQVTMQVVLDQRPPPPLPVVLLLALPRPLVVRRLLADITSYGVKKICLLQTTRVEKSYWQSPVLTEESVSQALLKGLEQARDTLLPEVLNYRSFRQFVETDLQTLFEASDQALIAHPAAKNGFVEPLGRRTLIAVGPEGGFVEQEVKCLQDVGFKGVNLGSRLLRVETAVSGILGHLSMLR